MTGPQNTDQLKILVCVKRVPAPGARINITDDGQRVDDTHLAFTTSPHEECAVEAAAQLVEEFGGEATVLTLGPAEAEEQLRYAVSVGMQRAVLLVQDDEWDPQRTSRALAGAIRDLEADQPFDLVVTVCDEAEQECPVFPGGGERQHWSFPDPSAVSGSEAQRLAAFREVFFAISDRIDGFLA
jgi:electron transfer flavoprotein alpha/beta subunit